MRNDIKALNRFFLKREGYSHKYPIDHAITIMELQAEELYKLKNILDPKRPYEMR